MTGEHARDCAKRLTTRRGLANIYLVLYVLNNVHLFAFCHQGESIFLISKTALASMEKSSFVENAFKAESFMYNRVLPAMEEVAHLGNPLPWPR